MSKEKHIPERKCIGCQGRFPKSALIRVVRQPSGEVVIDKTARAQGRGAYLCKSEQCLLAAHKKGRLRTALECAIPDEVYEALKAALV